MEIPHLNKIQPAQYNILFIYKITPYAIQIIFNSCMQWYVYYFFVALIDGKLDICDQKVQVLHWVAVHSDISICKSCWFRFFDIKGHLTRIIQRPLSTSSLPELME